MGERIARIGRLVRAEALKALSHPFFLVALVIMIGIVVAAVLLQSGGGARANAAFLFSGGLKFGFQFVAFYVIVFAGMSFAGEYDRGTMKALLIRPLTRTDLFLAKSIFIILLTLGLLVIVIYVSMLASVLMGDLGPVWDKETYIIHLSYGDLLQRAWTVVLITLCAPLAAAFLGMLISNLTESSGYAVATSMVLYFAIQVGQTFLGAGEKKFLFTFFPGEALEVLRQYSEGIFTYKLEDLNTLVLYSFAVPIASVLLFGSVAYLLFRLKNVHS